MNDREKIEQLLRRVWRMAGNFSDCDPNTYIELMTRQMITVMEETGTVRMIDSNFISFDGKF